MYLVKYAEYGGQSLFIDIQRIEHVTISGKKITFHVAGDAETAFLVDKNLEKQFMHALQLCNSGRQDVEKYYNGLQR